VKILFTVFLLVFTFLSFSQIAVGEWRDHLPYTKALGVTEGNNKIYCSTDAAIFIYNKDDNSLSKLSKVDGLSDVGITCISYNSFNDLLFIGYSNGNIDLIKSNQIINISDIERKLITGSKSINNVHFIDNKALISTGFGIVVLDTDKEEIKDTYYIGPLGDKICVNEITSDENYIYAATESGIYKALINDSFLSNYASWSRLTTIPNYESKINTLICFNNFLYYNFDSELSEQDTIYKFDLTNETWAYFDSTKTYTTYSLALCNDKILASCNNKLQIQNESGETELLVSWYMSGYSLGIRNALIDSNDDIWIADNNNGLVKRAESGTFEIFYPNGPASSSAVCMTVENSELWTVAGGVDGSWNNLWKQAEMYSFIDQHWETKNSKNISQLSGSKDAFRVIANPSDNKQVYVGCWGSGVLELYNGEYVGLYDYTNSSLQTIIANSSYCRIGGLAIDENDNLWVTNSGVPSPISVKTSENSWYSFEYGSEIDASTLGDIIVTKNNHKWVVIPRGGGLFAFYENETFENLSDDNTLKFSIVDENNAIITNDIFSIVEDHDGVIWVGTNKGIVAYYYPENVFGDDVFYAQRIVISSDVEGQASYLLENETVTAIAIDGANRKWIGTEASGTYLMSEDLSEEIYHFTKDNSPLVSDNIMSIAIDQNTGEIFFGTDKGIVSFRGTATEGSENNEQVYVYPNPVREDYTGLITITGLVTNSNVKITDIAGNIVYETTAEGGQAIWEGKNFSNQRVKTGVYLVFSSNEDGSKTNITKILFIN